MADPALAPVPATEKQLLTNSRAKAGRACLRLEQIEYRLRYRPVKEADPLRLGSLFHYGLEAWWFVRLPGELGRMALATRPSSDPLSVVLSDLGAWGPSWLGPELSLTAALRRVQAEPGYTDAERVLIEEMLRGYDRQWGAEPYVPVAVEIEFRAPMVNPLTGRKSETWDVGGKLDLIVQHVDTGALYFVEHKSAGVDISVGATYWKRLRMDSQVSTYYDGAEVLGYDVHGCIYDVAVKPRLALLPATPEAERELTLPKYRACPECKRKGAPLAPHHVNLTDSWVQAAICGTAAEYVLPDGRTIGIPCEPGKVISEPPRYKAGTRIADETIDEYRGRVALVIAGETDRFYAREIVARLDAQLDEYRIDLWQLGRLLREQELAGRYPRNPGACERWGRFCDYFDVCTGQASLDDPTRFKQIDRAHAELAPSTDF